jgi:hypothetical protein
MPIKSTFEIKLTMISNGKLRFQCVTVTNQVNQKAVNAQCTLNAILIFVYEKHNGPLIRFMKTRLLNEEELRK